MSETLFEYCLVAQPSVGAGGFSPFLSFLSPSLPFPLLQPDLTFPDFSSPYLSSPYLSSPDLSLHLPSYPSPSLPPFPFSKQTSYLILTSLAHSISTIKTPPLYLHLPHLPHLPYLPYLLHLMIAPKSMAGNATGWQAASAFHISCFPFLHLPSILARSHIAHLRFAPLRGRI